MIPKENIRAVLFDFGGTLGFDLEGYAEGFAALCTAAGYPATLADYRKASEEAKTAVPEPPKELEAWQDWRPEYHREILRRLGVPEGELDAMMLRLRKRFRYYSRPMCYAETDFVLRTLRGAGYVVGVISNIAPPLPIVLEELNITRHLHFLIASDTFGAQKPDPSIFHEGLRLANVNAGQAMYVGDSPGADVEGSSAVGMQPVLINRSGTPSEKDGLLTVTNLIEILDWLEIDCWEDEALHDLVPSR